MRNDIREGEEVACSDCNGTTYCDKCGGGGKLRVALIRNDFRIPIGLNAYQMQNLRWFFRQADRLSNQAYEFAQRIGGTLESPVGRGIYQMMWFNTGDWFGEIPMLLVEASNKYPEIMKMHQAPNQYEGDGPSAWDRLEHVTYWKSNV